MTLQQDMDSKRNWTQGEIDALKSKYKRTHFTHFSGQTSQAYRENYDRIFRKRKSRMKNPYKAYRSPKYLALITKLQAEGYEWKIGALHAYYLVPGNSQMGYPSFVNGSPFFIDNSKYPDEVKEVFEEIYGK